MVNLGLSIKIMTTVFRRVKHWRQQFKKVPVGAWFYVDGGQALQGPNLKYKKGYISSMTWSTLAGIGGNPTVTAVDSNAIVLRQPAAFGGQGRSFN